MSPQKPFPDRFYTVPQLAELLHVSERSVWRWLDKQELTAHRFGRLVRISEDSLRAFLDRNRPG